MRFEALRAKADEIREQLDPAAHGAARSLAQDGLTLREIADLMGRAEAPVSYGLIAKMLRGARSPRAWDGRGKVVTGG